MRLNALSYQEYVGDPREWILEEIILESTNLIVGTNSTGKSRTLNVIAALARLLKMPNEMPPSGHFEAKFIEDSNEYFYTVAIEQGTVLNELLRRNESVLMQRDARGIGSIYAEGLSSNLEFQVPVNLLAAVIKRDEIQHPFLTPLHNWAQSVRHMSFSTGLGKTNLYMPGLPAPPPDESDVNSTPRYFQKWQNELGEKFTAAVIKDMRRLNFPISELRVDGVITINAPGNIFGLAVKEDGIGSIVDQISISTGMYSLLILLIHINYLILSNLTACILLDDVGDGLDYRRAALLISMLIEKCSDTSIQLTMTSNNSFVMNAVPLANWTLLRRNKNKVSAFNYSNSKQKFDQFFEIGLNNFSFLELDFLEEIQFVGES